MERESKIYEIGYLLTPLIPEERINEEISVLRGLIEGNHGFIINEEGAKMQRLAYTIKKPNAGSFDSAYFGWIKFMAASDSAPEIKKSFDKNQNVVRFLITEITKEEALRKLPTGKFIRKKKPLAARPIEPKIKTEIKTEEIDKKLEELIGK